MGRKKLTVSGRKKPTSSDVAARAGVSQATVSMVLNKKYNVSFSKEVVQKVEQAAKELDMFCQSAEHMGKSAGKSCLSL